MPIICSKKATRPKYNLQSASQLNSPSAGPVSPVNLNESTIYPAGPSQEALGHRKPPLSSWSTPDAGGFTCYGGVDHMAGMAKISHCRPNGSPELETQHNLRNQTLARCLGASKKHCQTTRPANSGGWAWPGTLLAPKWPKMIHCGSG